MPIYAKPVKSSNPAFHNRDITVMTPNSVDVIPVPDNVVLCNGCNQNIADGYMIYLGKRELAQNRPYDVYCGSCLKHYFPKAIITGGV